MSAPEGNPHKPRTGVELLRLAVRLCDNGNETFNMRFEAHELCMLAHAWEESEYDIPPYQWNEEQIQDALNGIAPQWEKNK